MKSWIKAFRLRTLPLALSGWMIGLAVSAEYQAIEWTIAVLTIATAFLLQILSNLANDLGDAASGVDQDREGEQRMVSAGLISKSAMKRAVFICAVISLLSGIFLLYLTFPEDLLSALFFLLLGVFGIAAAIKYTVGENPYGYAGFGDLFVLIFFGIVLVYGTFYLQVQEYQFLPILPAISVGLFSVAVLNVNNIRDIESDMRAGKFSIPVRLGRSKAVSYHILLLVFGIMATVAYLIISKAVWVEYVFLIVAFPFYRNVRGVQSKKGHDLDPYLKQMALSSLGFALLFVLGQALSSYL